MPEIKNTFTQGKMNKDFDERLVPNGQYRDAMNVQVTTSEGSDVGTVQNVLGNQRVDIGGVPNGFTCVASIADEKNNTIYWFISSDNVDAIMQYNEETGYSPVFIDTLGVLKFPTRTITGINIIDDLLFWTDNFNEPRKINITRSVKGTIGTINNPVHTKLVVNDVVTSDDVTEDHITVVKKKPTSSPNIKINVGPSAPKPSLFEKILSRFAIRYKYEDGEYSAFGPFTDVIFNPTYPENIGQDTFYNVQEPYNLAMLNTIESLDIYDFRPPDIPEDVIQVDILYKQEDSPVVYSVASIKPNDPVPDGADFNYWDDFGFNQDSGLENSEYKGKYPVTTENIYAAVPSNQLIRPWDNVPRKALAQEVTGSRIVYGNYTQNYSLDPNISIIVDYVTRENLSDFQTGGLPSIKSQRNYQLGVVFGDKYGRETPVTTSTEGAVNVTWGDASLPNASISHQLITRLKGTIPEFADYYKFYVKETSNEYYNLIMDKAYSPTAQIETLQGQSEEKDHIWLSFASSDRNKLKIEDYIILKKKVGAGETQFPTENRFKILDIQNDAPDAIKFNFSILSSLSNTNSQPVSSPGGVLDDQGAAAGTGIFPQTSNYRIDTKGADVIYIDKQNFEAINTGNSASLGVNDDFVQDVKNVYISWNELPTSGVTSGQQSKRYRVVNIRLNSIGHYVLKLAESITEEDATLAAGTVTTVTPWDTTATMNPNLIFKVERKDLKDTDEFSGRFFVKVLAEGEIQSAVTTTLLDGYVVSASQDAYWFADPINSTDDNATTGVINSDAYNTTLPTDTVGSAAQHGNTLTTSTSTAAGIYATNVANWQTLQTYFTNNDGEGFFIDNLTFVAGQCSNNFYARNAGDPIRGNTTIYGQMEWSNSLEDLYDVNVFADVLNASGAVIGQGVLALPTDSANVTGYNQTPQEKNYWPRLMSGQRDSQPNLVKIFTNTPSGSLFSGGLVGNFPFDGESTKYYRNKNEGTFRWKPFALDSRFGWTTIGVNNDGFLANGFFNTPISEDRISTTTNLGLSTGPTIGGFVHALDGVIQTSDQHTDVNGIKKWRGEGELNTGAWNNTDNTYGTQNGEFYLHLSFLAPGNDLIPDGLLGSDLNSVDITGLNSLGTKLQAIYGGGIFTKEDGSLINTNQYSGAVVGLNRIIECEGNYTTDSGNSNASSDWFTLSGAPSETNGGQGYDTGTSAAGVPYLELHNKQWDPTFPLSRDPDGKIAAFKNSLQPGSTFKFTADTGNTIYSIENVAVKRLYNHTPWRRRFIWDSVNGLVAAGDSVEEAAIEWGESLGTPDETTKAAALATKIKNFAHPSNRRTVYVLKIDKDPTTGSFNPVGGNATLDANTASAIEFISVNPATLTGTVSTQPAIWETEPKGSDGLDIYYEAGSAIPCKLNFTNREVFAPVGCELKFVNLPGATVNISTGNILQSWDDNDALKFTVSSGFNINDSSGAAINYVGKKIKFIRKDTSFTTGVITSATSSTGSVIDTIEIEEDVASRNEVGLSWFNCFSFGNGIESDRIRDDFNEAQIGNGARASTTTEEPYQEETRKYGLIFSGLYNSNSGLNDLNQFIMAEKITKDLNPTYGSIQKLFSRQTDLITFCEDRVVKVLANKDAIFNADSTPNITANVNVLGQTIPFSGDYGISKNPESFAQESYRAYFTDVNRGAVLRLSQDGLTPISDAGMHDWFRDNLRSGGDLLGSYDEYKKLYNLTLKQVLEENIIINSDVSEGTVVVSTVVSGVEYLTNLSPSGEELDYSGILPLQPTNTTHTSYAGIQNPILQTLASVIEFPEIPVGFFQEELLSGPIAGTGTGLTFDVPTGDTIHSYTGVDNPFLQPVGAPLAKYGRFTGLTPLTTSSSAANINNVSDLQFVSGQGIVFNVAGGSLMAPNTYDNVPEQSAVTQDIINDFATAENNTIFNGEEVEIKITVVKPPHFNIYGSMPNLGIPGQAFPLSNFASNVAVQLFDGTQPIDETAVMKQVPASGTSVYNTVNTIPTTTDSFNLGFVDETTFGSFVATGFLSTTAITFPYITPEASNGQDVTQQISFYVKFYDGTDNASVLIQDFKLRINHDFLSLFNNPTNTTSKIIVSDIQINKTYRYAAPNVGGLTVPAPGIPAIPATVIPAWTQVSYNINNWIFDHSETPEITFQNSLNLYGPMNQAELITAVDPTVNVTGQTFDDDPNSLTFGDIISDGNSYNWYNPAPNGVTAPGDFSANAVYDSSSGNFSLIGNTVQTPLDDTVSIDCTNAANNTITVTQDLTSTPMVPGSWYMLDLHYDNVTSAAGQIIVENVLGANTGGTLGVRIVNDIQLVSTDGYNDPITRKYYTGDPNFPGQTTDPVYRALFRLDTNYTGDPNTLTIKFKNFVGEIKDIYLNKLDAQPTGGTIDLDWSSSFLGYEPFWRLPESGVGNIIDSSVPHHTLSVPDAYFKNDQWNFNTDTNTLGFNEPLGLLTQTWSTPNGAPQANTEGYEMLFTVSETVDPVSGSVNPISGSLYGFAVDGNLEGIYFAGVDAVGDYRITGNFDGVGPFTAEIYDTATSAFVTATNVTVSAASAVLSSPGFSSFTNRVHFAKTANNFVGALSNFSLKDKTTIFSGTTAGAWGFNGNVASVSPYVQFLNQQIVFTDADTSVQATQNLSNITSNTVYQVSFDYNITDGALVVYYFNASGLGFRVELTGSGTYNQQHTIGETTIASGELGETFVIRSGDTSTDATIDNITMQQVIGSAETTVSFSEDVRGWVSFKSFIPENAISVSKKYYTMKNGGLYEHHFEDQDRNTFYGTYADSTITTLLNSTPSSVKIFNTLNYEGSQSKIDVFSSGIANDGTVLSDIKPYNITAKDGWYVESLVTDKQSGTLNEFIEKEGKWFNYIRGAATGVKTSEFSFQGLGKISNNPQL